MKKKKRHIVVAKDSVRKQAARHLQPDDGVDGRAVRADERHVIRASRVVGICRDFMHGFGLL